MAASTSPSARSAARLRVLSGSRDELVASSSAPPRRLELPHLAGRLVELSGVGAPLCSVALRLVRDAQRAGDNVAWVTLASSTFYAPDARAMGIDLAALPVVLVPTSSTRGDDGPVLAAGRAVSHLLRSGAFGLVVLDLVAGSAGAHGVDLPTPLQSRLVGLAQKHGTALVALTRKELDQPSLGSLVSIHLSVARGPTRSHPDGHARCDVTVTATKDKRHGPGWSHTEQLRVPDGLA